mmetsp:Transcript_24643/g.67155  ORF Transcript_24643/g.67155 Transcript_24643/m.67155 type:complete len:234 (+) Transcript_24643:284-985(+)
MSHPQRPVLQVAATISKEAPLTPLGPQMQQQQQQQRHRRQQPHQQMLQQRRQQQRRQLATTGAITGLGALDACLSMVMLPLLQGNKQQHNSSGSRAAGAHNPQPDRSRPATPNSRATQTTQPRTTNRLSLPTPRRWSCCKQMALGAQRRRCCTAIVQGHALWWASLRPPWLTPSWQCSWTPSSSRPCRGLPLATAGWATLPLPSAFWTRSWTSCRRPAHTSRTSTRSCTKSRP